MATLSSGRSSNTSSPCTYLQMEHFQGISPKQVSGIGCTYHSHEVTPRGRAPGVLDLGSVTCWVGKETVLFNSDLQGDTGCEHGTRAIPNSWSSKQEETGREWGVGVQSWK